MEKIGRYKLGKTLGEGGMAVVYAATDSHLERTVAVKVIRPEYASTPQYRALFLKEAKTLAKLSDKAVVPIYDIGEENGILYLVMPLMEGGSLRERLDNYGRFTFTEAITFATHLASALDHFHGQGIIHRDLKPGNILYDRHGDPFIADFGIAKMQVRSGYTFTLALTPGYASPEQFKGEKLTQASDLYAFASIVFEILTGRPPFEAETVEAWMYQHLSQPAPDIRKFRPDLPAGVTSVFQRALAKEPTARYSSVGAFISALAKVRYEPTATTPQTGIPIDNADTLASFAPAHLEQWGRPALIEEFAPLLSDRTRSQLWRLPFLIGGIVLILVAVVWSNVFQPKPPTTRQATYTLSQLVGGPDCGYSGISGTIYNHDGSPRAGVTVEVFNEYGFMIAPVTNNTGFYEARIESRPRADLAGLWHIRVMENGISNSNEIGVILSDSCTNPGDLTRVIVDFNRTQ